VVRRWSEGGQKVARRWSEGGQKEPTADDVRRRREQRAAVLRLERLALLLGRVHDRSVERLHRQALRPALARGLRVGRTRPPLVVRLPVTLPAIATIAVVVTALGLGLGLGGRRLLGLLALLRLDRPASSVSGSAKPTRL
jgi:hypothetical protein